MKRFRVTATSYNGREVGKFKVHDGCFHLSASNIRTATKAAADVWYRDHRPKGARTKLVELTVREL